MAIRTVLVHVDASEGNAARLQHAIALASVHNARLIGLYVLPHLRVPSHSGAFVPTELVQVFRDNIHHQHVSLRSEFETVTREADIDAQWRSDEGYAAETVKLHARYADIVIVGQQDDFTPWVDETVTDSVALSCGRPTIVIPTVPTTSHIGSRIAVAWDGSREAVRAVYDAMPLLEQAEEVRVLAVDATTSGAGHGQEPCADICQQLARHGVTAVGQPIDSESLGVGRMLGLYVKEHCSDLLVMGAYGHSRIRELVLGGTTRYVLKHMSVPVLLSH